MDAAYFWWALIGWIDTLIFDATLVTCLLSPKLEILHLALLATGWG